MDLDLPEMLEIIDKRELAMCRRLLIRYKQSLTLKPKISLETRIQALPQELQDMILHFKLLRELPQEQELHFDKFRNQYTVIVPGDSCKLDYTTASRAELARRPLDYRTFDAKGDAHRQEGPIPFRHVVHVDLSYRPSVALQINRRTRAAIAKVFYENTVLLMTSPFRWSPGEKVIGCLPGFWAKMYERGCWYRKGTLHEDFVLSLSEEHREMARVLWAD